MGSWNGHFRCSHGAIQGIGACNRFLADVHYSLNGLEEVLYVRGTCKLHGKVESLNGWAYEDLTGWPKEA